jgi:hypothetical protein
MMMYCKKAQPALKEKKYREREPEREKEHHNFIFSLLRFYLNY